MNRSTFFYGLLFLLLSILCPAVPAMGDPDFELTAPGQLPKWSGGFWIRLSAQDFKARIVENPTRAFSGKRFLQLSHPGKNALYTAGFPRITCQQDKKYILTAKVRGNGRLMMCFFRYDRKLKNRPWSNKSALPYQKLAQDKWQELRLEFVPQPGDFCMTPAFAIREGDADIDAVSLKTEAVSAAAAPRNLPAVKAAVKRPEAKIPQSTAEQICSSFEKWNSSLPEGWTTDPWRKNDIVKKSVLGADAPDILGRYALFLDGKLVMTPGMKFKGNAKGRRMRVSFYARGDEGNFKVFLREGRYGNVDYLMEVFSSDTTGAWKKYSGEIALTQGFVNNATVELNGKNVEIDHLQFYCVKPTEGSTCYTIPVIRTSPVIDGNAGDAAWQLAAGGSDAFQVAGAANATTALKRQTQFKLCSDGKKLYFLFVTPDAANLKKDAEKRDSAVYSDDSVEFHINPEPGNAHPAKAYQLVFNARGTVFDQCRENGRFSSRFHAWDAPGLRHKSVIKNNTWILEGELPLDSIGLKPEKPFSMNICLNRCNPTALATITGGNFENLGAMPEMIVSAKRPAVSWQTLEGFGNMTVNVINPGKTASTCTLNFMLDSQNAFINKEQTLTIPAAGSLPLYFSTPQGAGNFGSMVLAAKDKSGKLIFRQTVSFSKAMQPVPEVEKPLELHILPEQNKIAVNIFPARKGFLPFDHLTVEGLPGGTRKFKKEELADYDGMLFIKLPANFQHGSRTNLRISLFNATGELLNFVSKTHQHDDNMIVKDDPALYRGVLPPHQPIRVTGKNQFQTAFRTYTIGGNGLPEMVISRNQKVLHAPIALTAQDANGKNIKGRNGSFRILSSSAEKLEFSGSTIFPGFTVKLKGRAEFDGTIFYQAQIIAPEPVKLQRLTLHVPINKLDYFHSYLDTSLRLWMCRQPDKGEYRHPSVPVWQKDSSLVPEGFRRFVLYFFPAGDGLIWSSRKVLPGVIKNSFLPYLTFGNHIFGMGLFADTDKGWVNDKNSAVHQIFRKNGLETVQTHFIAAPAVLHGTRNLEFGLTVTPSKLKTLTRKEDRRSYIGASHSCFMDRSCSPTVCKDPKLMDLQCERIVKKGEIPLLWMCKELYPQGDPVARYLDSEWRTRPGAKWLMHHYMPSHAFGLDPRDYEAPAGCFPPSRIDFHSSRFEKLFAQIPHLMGVYWDENYMKPCGNPNHADCVYKLPDGRTQGRAWWNAIREIDRRLRFTLVRHGRPGGSIALFTGEGLIPHAMAFGDVNTMGEHHTHGIDYIDYWTLHATEIMAAGAWGIDVGFLGMFYEEKDRRNIALNRAQLAVVKLFNAHFQASWIFNQELAAHFKKIDQKFNYALPGTVFCGYYSQEGKKAVQNLPYDVKASFYVHPGRNALVFITNLNKKTQKVSPLFDLAPWQLKNFEAYDAENGKPLNLQELTIKGHDLRVLELRKK